MPGQIPRELKLLFTHTLMALEMNSSIKKQIEQKQTNRARKHPVKTGLQRNVIFTRAVHTFFRGNLLLSRRKSRLSCGCICFGHTQTVILKEKSEVRICKSCSLIFRGMLLLSQGQLQNYLEGRWKIESVHCHAELVFC